MLLDVCTKVNMIIPVYREFHHGRSFFAMKETVYQISVLCPLVR